VIATKAKAFVLLSKAKQLRGFTLKLDLFGGQNAN
jgi:hypothetical protein